MIKKNSTNKKFFSFSIERELIAIIIIATIATFITTYLAILKQEKLLTSAPIDTGIFVNVIQNLLHGNFFNTSLGLTEHLVSSNMLDVHSFFIFLFIAPFFFIFNSVGFLYFLQNGLLYFSGIVVYFLTKKKINSKSQAFLIALSFMSTPIIYFNSLGEFHPENLGIIFFLLSFYFLIDKKYYRFIIFAFLSFFCLEYIALYFISLSIVLFFFYRKEYSKKYILTTLVLGLFWLFFNYVVIKNIISVERAPDLFHHYFSKWQIKGSGTFDISGLSSLMIFFIQNPLEVLESIFAPAKWVYLFSLINWLIVIVLINYRFILFVLPTGIYFVMNDGIFFHDIHSYYFNFLFLAGIISLIEVINKWQAKKMIINGLVALLLLTNFYYLFINTKPTFSYNTLTQIPLGDRLKIAQDIIEKIPADAGVLAQHRYTYYLANRPDFFLANIFRDDEKDFDKAIREKTLIKAKYYDNIDYIFVDLVSDQPCHPNAFYCTRSKPEDIEKRKKAVMNLLNSGKWQLKKNQEGIILLQKIF